MRRVDQARGGSLRQRFVDFDNRHVPGMRKGRLRKKTKASRQASKDTYDLISETLNYVSPALLTLKLCITSDFRTFSFPNHHRGKCRLPRLPIPEELVLDYRFHRKHPTRLYTLGLGETLA